ncbi:MAG TPA: hypothetical protein VKD21_01445 [Acidimicrobiales bacterium]|nr:hypothetical protein [Acidimicrobiales bacterium]
MAKAEFDGFRRNEWVKNLDDLPGVPAGTRGRVYLVEGFTWTRYRVLFDNGADIGSLDGAVLARPRDFASALERRDQAALAAETAADEAEAAAEGGAVPADEDKTVNGVSVPAHLLERSKRARERLAAA